MWYGVRYSCMLSCAITYRGVLLRHENSCGFCMTQYFNASSVTQHPRSAARAPVPLKSRIEGGTHALFLSNFPRFIGRLFSEPRLGSGSPPTVEFDCASMALCRPRVSRMDHFESERLAELRHVAV